MSRRHDLEAELPRLNPSNYEVTSEETPDYNCIGWAIGDDQNHWWPDSTRQSRWPRTIPRERRIDNFVTFFELHGYTVCDSRELEADVEKVALFAKSSLPTHAARQLACGRWTSKCGMSVDISHDLDALECGDYGQVVAVLSRRRT